MSNEMDKEQEAYKKIDGLLAEASAKIEEARAIAAAADLYFNPDTPYVINAWQSSEWSSSSMYC